MNVAGRLPELIERPASLLVPTSWDQSCCDLHPTDSQCGGGTWRCIWPIKWNVGAAYKKGQSRLYFLRHLRSFSLCWTMLRTLGSGQYYNVYTLLCTVVRWASSLNVRDTNRLNKIIRKACHVVGDDLDSLTVVAERRMLSKIESPGLSLLLPPQCAGQLHV